MDERRVLDQFLGSIKSVAMDLDQAALDACTGELWAMDNQIQGAQKSFARLLELAKELHTIEKD